MLVLTRRKNEAVLLTTPEGRTITVTVCLCRNNTVKLGFNADNDVEIAREEIAERD